jgi:methyl-accepting chemotaxis protein
MAGGAMTISRYRALRRALTWPIASRSLATMAVVGTILNVINQGDAILWSGAINWWKVLLTYCVPFCVATFGAYSAYREAGPR